MTDLRVKPKLLIQSTSYLYLCFQLNLLNFCRLGNFVMGFFMALIALVLGFILEYGKDFFDAETLDALKELAITML